MTRFRHWLIRKLACGDMIMMNFEIRSDNRLIKRNLGSALIADVDITVSNAQCGIRFSRGTKSGIAALDIVSDNRGQWMIADTYIRMMKP